MPSPSYTYTLTNGTSADADQVMQNFDDILNGITDGTKDLSIAALTAAGTATFNGNVTLGNATSDDITVTGSLASSIPIKTDASYDIGSSTLGLRYAYFGGNSNRVRIGASASTSATYNLTLPTTAGTSGYKLITDGSGNLSWALDVLGTTTNDSAATGYVGEYPTPGTASGVNAATSGNFKSIASVSLTAGDWDIYAVGTLSTNSATLTGILDVAISIDTTDSDGGLSLGTSLGRVRNNPNTGSSAFTGVTISGYRVSLSSTSTIYVNGAVSYSAGTPQWRGVIGARRVR